MSIIETMHVPIHSCVQTCNFPILYWNVWGGGGGGSAIKLRRQAKLGKILSVKVHNSAKICQTWIISSHALVDLWYNIPAKCRSACGEIFHVRQILAELWTLTLRIFTHLSLSSQLFLHWSSIQVSFKSMQGCRRRWEDKLKCVKILSVKDHNSAKICQTWIISPHALLDL